MTAVLLFYFLASGPRVARGLFWMVPPHRRPLVASIWKHLDPVLFRYFLGVLAVVVYATIAAYIGLGVILGIHHALLLALLTGILETVPVVGPTSAAVIAGLISLRTATRNRQHPRLCRLCDCAAAIDRPALRPHRARPRGACAPGADHLLLPRRRRGARHPRRHSRRAGRPAGQEHARDALWRRGGVSALLHRAMSSFPPWRKFGYIVTVRGNFLGVRRLPRIGGRTAGTRSWRCGIPPGRHCRSRTGHPWLADLLFALDGRLQRRHAVFEYTGNPVCIFRVDIACSPERLALHDGTRLQRGERIVRLHFWNEHVPPVPQDGATIAWARQMQHAIAISLQELACYLQVASRSGRHRGDLRRRALWHPNAVRTACPDHGPLRLRGDRPPGAAADGGAPAPIRRKRADFADRVCAERQYTSSRHAQARASADLSLAPNAGREIRPCRPTGVGAG